MKIKVTVNQMKKILDTEPAKFPITLQMDKISKYEVQELMTLLKNKTN